MEIPYPRQSLGWAFQRVMRAWDIPEARLARHLAVSPTELVALAVCPLPPMSSPDFDTRIDQLARTFGIPRWRLEFVCRAAALDTSHVRD